MARLVDPFHDVNSRYGAHMGRTSNPHWVFTDKRRLCAMHQGGGDGYDKGGAYWGLPSNVWAVWERGEHDSVQYVRANSRQHAIGLIIGGFNL